MAKDNTLLYAGLAVAAYFIFVKKPAAAATPGYATVLPSSTQLPGNSNIATTLLTSLATLAPTVVKALTPTPQTYAQANNTVPLTAVSEDSPSSSAPAIQTTLPGASTANLLSSLPTSLPGADTASILASNTVSTDNSDEYENMFENGDYPGADISGVNRLSSRRAARMGLY